MADQYQIFTDELVDAVLPLNDAPIYTIRFNEHL